MTESTNAQAGRAAQVWDDFRLRLYLGTMRGRFGVIDTLALPNMRDLRPLRLDVLFVQPLLARREVSATTGPETWPEGVGLFAALEAAPQLVLLGDPGSGKTTLTSWLAWRLSAGLVSPLPDMLANRLPIACVLREMKANAFAPGTGIADLAVLVAELLLGEQMEAKMETALREWVAAGRYVLILDGADEIPVEQRKVVADWMRQAKEDGALALATSRLVGYEDWPVDRPYQERAPECGGLPVEDDGLPEGVDADIRLAALFNARKALPGMPDGSADAEADAAAWAQRMYLMPFDPKRVAAFLNNWYMQRCGSEQEAREKTRDLLLALNKSEATQELARTPNLLSLMAIVFRERAHLPDGKALLYKEIANAYINTIDQQRKISAGDALAPYGLETRETWLGFVGFQMQLLRAATEDGERNAGVLVEERKVLEWLQQAMQHSGMANAEANAREFLKWVARRSGLLLPRGEGVYAFVHLSFQEYFCARFLAGRIGSPAFVRNSLPEDAPVTRPMLLAWSKSAIWRETLVYLLELVSGEKDSDWVAELIEILFGGMTDDSLIFDAQSELVARILLDRHIHANAQWKRRLAWRCSAGVRLPQTLIFRALLLGGYAALLRDQPEGDGEGDGLNSLAHQTLEAVGNSEDIFVLWAAGSALSDVTALTGLPNLVFLFLDYTQVQDIAPLAALINLKYLFMDNTLVEDLAPLSAMHKLEVLSLRNTPVRDITPLAALSHLRLLFIENSQVQDISVLAHNKRIHIFGKPKKPASQSRGSKPKAAKPRKSAAR